MRKAGNAGYRQKLLCRKGKKCFDNLANQLHKNKKDKLLQIGKSRDFLVIKIPQIPRNMNLLIKIIL